MTKSTFTVEEVCSRFDITPRTLHYYEEIGLIPEVPRTEGRHRYYDLQTVELLDHIFRLKTTLGISLQEISSILAAEQSLEQLKEAYRKEESDEEKLNILEQGAVLLQSLTDRMDERIRSLESLRDGYRRRLDNVNRLNKDKRHAFTEKSSHIHDILSET